MSVSTSYEISVSDAEYVIYVFISVSSHDLHKLLTWVSIFCNKNKWTCFDFWHMSLLSDCYSCTELVEYFPK
jgi:hypothetical protein